jgi:DegV family protein with EDD domain
MIGIITDSTCDIPKQLLEQYRIGIVPLTVIWGDEQYRDRVDIQPDAFYRRLAADRRHPTTSTSTLADYQQAYREAISNGADELVVLTVSSPLSGVHQMAAQAAQQEKVPVSVVDSRGTTMGLGWQVLAAARARDAGANMQEILHCADEVRRQVMLIVYMDTLKYLERGGRIGQAVKWVGVALHVRPIVTVNHQSGLVEAVGLARTRKGGVETIFNKFADFLHGKSNLHIAVLHGNAPQDAQVLAERVRAELNPAELIESITGPVLGVHTGPGALALCGYGEVPAG